MIVCTGYYCLFDLTFLLFYHNWCELTHENGPDKEVDSEVILGEDIIGNRWKDQ